MDLDSRRRRCAGAGPVDADPDVLTYTRVHMTHWVDTQRKRDMCRVSLFQSHALDTAREALIHVGHVRKCAWIKQGLAGGAARAPVLLNITALGDIEVAHELVGRQGAKLFFIEDGNFSPLTRLVEFVDVDAGEPGLMKGRL